MQQTSQHKATSRPLKASTTTGLIHNRPPKGHHHHHWPNPQQASKRSSLASKFHHSLLQATTRFPKHYRHLKSTEKFHSIEVQHTASQ